MITLTAKPAHLLYLQTTYGLKVHPKSPLQRVITGLGATQPERDASLSLPVPEAVLADMLQAAYDPGVVLRLTAGGNQIAPEIYYISFAGGSERAAWVGLMNSGDIYIQGFESPEDCLDWVMRLLNPTGYAHEDPAVLPRSMDRDVFLMSLHLLDMFRRCYYSSMLDYRRDGIFSFSGKEYRESWRSALCSTDYRWLLPSATMLLPQALKVDVETLNADVTGLVESGLAAKGMENQDADDYVFAGAVEELGAEFLTGWISSVGIEIPEKPGTALLMFGSLKSIHIFSLAGNQIAYEVAGETKSRAALGEFLARAGAGQAAAAPTAAASRFCTQCGHKLEAGSKFCPSCGAKV